MHTDVCHLSAADLITEYRAKRLSPVDVTTAVLERIEQLNGTYNAFCVVDPNQALAQARASEARWAKGRPAGLVDGVPISVKDLILAKGWPTLRGSRTIDPKQAWDEDGPPVARMREHGAIILGKTTTPEFGWKGVTDSPLTGLTVNPWDPTLTPGGSSGGAAAAAALGLGALHIATDGAGSIRMPAAFCGLFGYKPTFGIVAVHPHSPVGTLWHQGPIVRTVTDAALALTVISEPDLRDWYSVPHATSDFGAVLGSEVDGLRIAYSRNLGYAQVDQEVADLVDKAVAWFANAGAEVDEIDPGFSDPIDTMLVLWSVALAFAVDPLTETQRSLVDPPVLDIAEQGFSTSATSYRRAERDRDALGRHMQLFHREYDLLLTPQLPITAFAAGLEVPEGRAMTRWWEWSPFTYPFNLTQQPAACLPCGFTDEGLPAALQVVGTRFADATVLRACQAYESDNPFVMPSVLD